MKIYELLDEKFEKILSGTCLTIIREENKKIASKYNSLEEESLLDAKNDFLKYIHNYLFLKQYDIISIDDEKILTNLNGNNCEFLIDFDWSFEENIVKIKVLDKGLKTGISKHDIKYVFFISPNKSNFILLNCENLKKQIKENRENFEVITLNDNLFKTQFISFDLSKLNQKIKIFRLK